MAPLRIGFVGVGNMGQCAHLQNYVALPEECEVVALAEVKPEQGKRVAERWGVPNVYTDHMAMLAEQELDGIVASQPYGRHGQLLPDLFTKGVPVLTEKPLARSVEVGEKLVEALKKTDAQHYLGYHKRSDPATMYALNQINQFKASGEIGALRYLRIAMPPSDWIAGGFAHLIRTDEPVPSLAWDESAKGMSEEAAKAYDVFVNYYVHQINLIRHLLSDDYHIEYVDPSEVVLVARTESGITATIEMSAYRSTISWDEAAFVAFEQGYIQLELPAPVASNRPGKVTVFKDLGEDAPPMTCSPDLPWVSAMRQQALNFCKAIRGEHTPLCTAEDALKDLHACREYISKVYGE